MKRKIDIKGIILLEIAFFVYALSSLFSKTAMFQNPTLLHTLTFYGLSIVMLGIYAIIWQQVLKKMDLSTAFSNKGVTIIWGLLFGALFFKEQITWGMILGSMIVIAGVVVMMKEKEKEDD